MNIRFLVPGKIKERFLSAGQDEYLKRLSKYAKIQVVNLREEVPNSSSASDIKRALDREAMRNLKLIRDDETVFLADVNAAEYNSDEFSSLFEREISKNGNIVFIFGSSYGFSDYIKKRADVVFSLSKLTFTHQMAYLLTLEQVYRAFKIINNETYNK